MASLSSTGFKAVDTAYKKGTSNQETLPKAVVPTKPAVGAVVKTQGGNYQVVAKGTAGAQYNKESGLYSVKLETPTSAGFKAVDTAYTAPKVTTAAVTPTRASMSGMPSSSSSTTVKAPATSTVASPVTSAKAVTPTRASITGAPTSSAVKSNYSPALTSAVSAVKKFGGDVLTADTGAKKVWEQVNGVAKALYAPTKEQSTLDANKASADLAFKQAVKSGNKAVIQSAQKKNVLALGAAAQPSAMNMVLGSINGVEKVGAKALKGVGKAVISEASKIIESVPGRDLFQAISDAGVKLETKAEVVAMVNKMVADKVSLTSAQSMISNLAHNGQLDATTFKTASDALKNANAAASAVKQAVTEAPKSAELPRSTRDPGKKQTVKPSAPESMTPSQLAAQDSADAKLIEESRVRLGKTTTEPPAAVNTTEADGIMAEKAKSKERETPSSVKDVAIDNANNGTEGFPLTAEEQAADDAASNLKNKVETPKSVFQKIKSSKAFKIGRAATAVGGLGGLGLYMLGSTSKDQKNGDGTGKTTDQDLQDIIDYSNGEDTGADTAVPAANTSATIARSASPLLMSTSSMDTGIGTGGDTGMGEGAYGSTYSPTGMTGGTGTGSAYTGAGGATPTKYYTLNSAGGYDENSGYIGPDGHTYVDEALSQPIPTDSVVSTVDASGKQHFWYNNPDYTASNGGSSETTLDENGLPNTGGFASQDPTLEDTTAEEDTTISDIVGQILDANQEYLDSQYAAIDAQAEDDIAALKETMAARGMFNSDLELSMEQKIKDNAESQKDTLKGNLINQAYSTALDYVEKQQTLEQSKYETDADTATAEAKAIADAKANAAAMGYKWAALSETQKKNAIDAAYKQGTLKIQQQKANTSQYSATHKSSGAKSVSTTALAKLVEAASNALHVGHPTKSSVQSAVRAAAALYGGTESDVQNAVSVALTNAGLK